jgi:hypothetical protein
MIEDSFTKAIKKAIDMEIEEAVKIATSKARDELEKRIPEIVSGISIRIMKRVNIERMADELVIHIKIEKE